MEAQCTFRVAGKRPEIWDPVTGTMHAAGRFREKNGRTGMHMSLEPAGSVFVVFGGTAARRAPSRAVSGSRRWRSR